MGFFKRVHKVVSYIPEGRVMSYADIAEVLESPRMAKFVGFAMKTCPADYPWQRVVRTNGCINMGDLQVMLLNREGVGFVEPGYVDMKKYRLHPADMRLRMDAAGDEE